MTKGEIFGLIAGVFCLYSIWVILQLFFYSKEPATLKLLYKAIFTPWRKIEMEDKDKAYYQSRNHFEKRRTERINGDQFW